jgi:hypothetical protein
VGLAKALLEQVRMALEPHLVTNLTEDERASVLRVPVRAAEASRTLAEVAVLRPAIAAAADFDPVEVVEDIDNVEALAGLADLCELLRRWAADSQLVWESEYYQRSLELHRLAKVRAESDGSIAPLVAPFSELFASRKKPAKAS